MSDLIKVSIESVGATAQQHLVMMAAFRRYWPDIPINAVGVTSDFVNWPIQHHDVAEFSRFYPDQVFAVYINDGADALGVCYHHNATSYYEEATVTYPVFQEENLYALPHEAPRACVTIVVLDGIVQEVMDLPADYGYNVVDLDGDGASDAYCCRGASGDLMWLCGSCLASHLNMITNIYHSTTYPGTQCDKCDLVLSDD